MTEQTRVNVQESRSKLSFAKLNTTKAQLAQEVFTAYIDILKSNSKIEALQIYMDLTKAKLKELTKKYAMNLVSKVDVLQIKVDYHTSQISLKREQQVHDIALLKLKQLIGNDTFTLLFKSDMNASTDPKITINSVENIILVGDKNDTGESNLSTISAEQWTGVENYTISARDFNITDIRSAVKSITFKDYNGTVRSELTALASTAFSTSDTLIVTSTKIIGDINLTFGVKSDDIYNYNLKAIGNTSLTRFILDHTDKLDKVVISGDSNVTLETNSTDGKKGLVVKTIDASGLSKSFSYTVTGTTGTTVTGGTKDDSLTDGQSDDIMIGGPGADDINISNGGADTIQVNYVGDVGVTTGTEDTVHGFVSGVDGIKIVGLSAGTPQNFIDGNQTVLINATVENVVTLANGIFAKGNLYANIYTLGGAGAKSFLVFDRNDDGKADGVITLKGVDGTDSIQRLKYTDMK